MRKNQSGFTLVEIAIVLVIIGLLLGGVLKGQELINSAKAKAIINDFRNTTTMIAAYQDRFRALPGDDKNAEANFPGNAGIKGDGNGQIAGNWDSTASADESVRVWIHLRLANLASGSTALASSSSGSGGSNFVEPTNAEGGRIGISSTPGVSNMKGNLFVCQGNISGRLAQQVDRTMDDGDPTQGSIQGVVQANSGSASSSSSSSSSSGGTATIYTESSLYTLCNSL